jgi:cytochrome c553
MKKIALTMIFAGATLMAADGAALYAKCAGCHGKDGKTPALGKSAPIDTLDAATIVKDLEGYKAGTLNKHGMGGVMKGQAAALSEDDMKALADYISKLGK